MCMFKKKWLTLRSWRAFEIFISYTFYFYTIVLLYFCGFFKTLLLLNITPHLFLYIYVFMYSYFKIHRLLKLLLQNMVQKNMILFWKLHRKSQARSLSSKRQWLATWVKRTNQKGGSGSISSPWSAFLYFFYWLQDKFWDMRMSLQHIKAYQSFTWKN